MSDIPAPFRGEITTASAEEDPRQKDIVDALRRQFALKDGAMVNRVIVTDTEITIEYFPPGQSVGDIPEMRRVTAKRVPAEKYPA